ncbi:hypothetical protein EDM68_05565 [Candidatus Uhrbacteria bacterium]|nr:MAG: hypothetical protein EDM68_05565 [Candidatus Uhrbacteria bacterium]
MSTKFCRVVPVLRTPAGIDAFDYAVPEGATYDVGDLVWVPFRRRKTPALVTEMLTTSPFAQKAQNVIGSYAGIRLPEASVGLLHWLSEWTFASRPSVLLSWLRNLPKRPAEIGPFKAARRDAGMEAVWTADANRSLIEAAQNAGGRVLILTPWLASAKRLADEIPGSALLLAEQADGLFFERWTNWASKPEGVLITTRVGSWLSPLAETILLHLPEQDDHKQDELNPRYDARRIAAWCAQHAGIEVRAFGVTPPLASDEPAPDLELPYEIVIRNPKGHSPIPTVQADVLNTIRDHEGPRVIVHPVRGVAARFTCRDCGWQAVCERCDFPLSQEIDAAACRRCGWTGAPPLSCLSCGGFDLGKSIPGIERLKSAWAKHESDIPVEWRTLAMDEFEAPLPEHAIVVVTDASFLSGAVEDIRRDERLVAAVRHLASRVQAAGGRLVLQASEHHATLLETCVTSDGYRAYQERERALRESFGYPPAVRLVKILVDGTGHDARRWMSSAGSAVKTAGGELRGPYAVAYRPRSRKARWVVHAVFPKRMEHKRLMTVFQPLSKDVIIDLDPIAFFR